MSAVEVRVNGVGAGALQQRNSHSGKGGAANGAVEPVGSDALANSNSDAVHAFNKSGSTADHATSNGHGGGGGGGGDNGLLGVSSAGDAPAISESREEASHANATKSHQHVPAASETLRLPKFTKNQRKIDHSNHMHCCDPPPPGRVISPAAAAASPDNGNGILCRNDVGFHGIAAHNVGTRDHMEDRHRIQYGKPDGLYRAFFGVFDGHGGEEASHYTHEHLGRLVAEQLYLQYQAKSGPGAGPGLLQPVARPGQANGHAHAAAAAAAESNGNANVSPAALAAVSVTPQALQALGLDYKGALERAFDILEEDVLRQSRTLGCKDGTTVTCVLVTHDTLYAANTGDSRTVLCRDGNAVALSHDHKPSTAEERARIEAAGGEVRAVLVDRAAFCCFSAKKIPHGAERLWPGGFSVSRAVGDIDYKDVRRKKIKSVGVLIHRPDVTVTSLNPRDQFVICGSDGLWDVLTNQQAVEFVLREMRKKKRDESLHDIAQKLADHAYSLGSEDNITALITFFVNHDLPFKQ